MRTVFYIVGVVALLGGIACLIAAKLGSVTPITGYCAGVFLAVAGGVHFLAAHWRYRGHWSFVTGIALVTLGLCSAATGVEYLIQGTTSDLFEGAVLSFLFTMFGVLTLWSGHKLHRCTLEIERLAVSRNFGADQATCAECGGAFNKQDMVQHDKSYVCARCKPVFFEKLREGAKGVVP